MKAFEVAVKKEGLRTDLMRTQLKGGGKLEADPYAEERAAAKESIEQLNNDLNSILQNGIMSTIDLLGQGIEDIASGDFDIKDFGKTALQTVGEFLKMFGEALVAYAISVKAFEGAFGNPALALGVGIAAIALGSILSGLGQSAPKTTGSSDASGGGGAQSGSLGYFETNNQILTTRISGDDLVFVLDRANKKNANV